MPDSPDLLWYVSYGSNMMASRFGCYIMGGRPPGATRCYLGSRDRRWPLPNTAWELPGQITFAGRFTVWHPAGCGAAFYVPGNPGRVLARAWLVSRWQFMDIVAQENGGEAGDIDSELSDVLTSREGRGTIGAGAYDLLLRCGQRDGHPAWTFTTSRDTDELGLNSPSQAYLEMLAGGLEETAGMPRARALEYLRSLPGATP